MVNKSVFFKVLVTAFLVMQGQAGAMEEEKATKMKAILSPKFGKHSVKITQEQIQDIYSHGTLRNEGGVWAATWNSDDPNIYFKLESRSLTREKLPKNFLVYPYKTIKYMDCMEYKFRLVNQGKDTNLNKLVFRFSILRYDLSKLEKMRKKKNISKEGLKERMTDLRSLRRENFINSPPSQQIGEVEKFEQEKYLKVYDKKLKKTFSVPRMPKRMLNQTNENTQTLLDDKEFDTIVSTSKKLAPKPKKDNLRTSVSNSNNEKQRLTYRQRSKSVNKNLGKKVKKTEEAQEETKNKEEEKSE